jgi:hypothetical protein
MQPEEYRRSRKDFRRCDGLFRRVHAAGRNSMGPGATTARSDMTRTRPSTSFERASASPARMFFEIKVGEPTEASHVEGEVRPRRRGDSLLAGARSL